VKADASYDLGCLPSAETLRRIRWPLRPRSRDRHTTFRAMGRPLDDALAPPWVFVRSSPVHSGMSPEPRRSFRPPYPPMVSPTAVHFELGPRSLDPAAVFAARMPSLFETRRRLTTSATCLRRAGNQTPTLMSSQGRWPRPPSFSYASRISLARAVMRGEPRDVRFDDPGAGSSRLRRFAQPRCLQERPATAGFTRTMHSED
jgi:hypothetical protein